MKTSCGTSTCLDNIIEITIDNDAAAIRNYEHGLGSEWRDVLELPKQRCMFAPAFHDLPKESRPLFPVAGNKPGQSGLKHLLHFLVRKKPISFALLARRNRCKHIRMRLT